MKLFTNVVFLQGDDAIEALEAFNRDTDDAFEYLQQWDYGSENDHDGSDELINGDSDHLFVHGEYILSVNTTIGYMGLQRFNGFRSMFSQIHTIASDYPELQGMLEDAENNMYDCTVYFVIADWLEDNNFPGFATHVRNIAERMEDIPNQLKRLQILAER